MDSGYFASALYFLIFVCQINFLILVETGVVDIHAQCYSLWLSI